MTEQALYEVHLDRSLGSNNLRYIIYFVEIEGVKEHICMVIYNEDNEPHSLFTTYNPRAYLGDLDLPRCIKDMKRGYGFSINFDVSSRTQVSISPARKLQVGNHRNKEFPDVAFGAAGERRQWPLFYGLRFRREDTPALVITMHNLDGTKEELNW